MLRPDSKTMQAIRGIITTAPTFFDQYIFHLEADRELERSMMENCDAEQTEIYKGRCQKCTDHIQFLKSLLPTDGE